MDTAAEALGAQLSAASEELQRVSDGLGTKFNTRNTGTTGAAINPLDLLERIKRLQEQLPTLQADCEQIAAKKAELREATAVTMVANRQAITMLHRRAGLPHLPAESSTTVA